MARRRKSESLDTSPGEDRQPQLAGGPSAGPLDRRHLEVINNLLSSCQETRNYLNKCKDCFINVDEEAAANDEQERVAAAIKAKFFPLER